MTSKILVAYFTKGGASATYAKIITEELATSGLPADLTNLAEDIPDITPYETIILGTGVRISMVYRKWRKVLGQKTLAGKQLYLFLSSGTAIREPEKAVDKWLKPLVKKYGLNPVSMISFPGVFPGKWAEKLEDKNPLRPERAREWAQQIAVAVKKGA